ncbi:MAG: 2,3-bisphosphoglycerate-independent phosphoglycerate mutase, partial [Chloroflexi bacterium]|nr:2,3-bisphosphoglycerate-independent phosphoglycerate mutase [Chloroflexota bacterium]
CGATDPIAPGITPGSGPAHLALFGYDPLQFDIGRGILSALGIGFPVEGSDVAARANFATVDPQGLISDRRAGRPSTEVNRQLVEKLRQIQVPGCQIFVETESQHRALVVFRGEGLSDQLTDSDPQVLGAAPLRVQGTAPEAGRTAELVNTFLDRSREALADSYPANALLLRGFAKYPDIPRMPDVYGISPAGIAIYPMYKGLARLVGMDTFHGGETFGDSVAVLEEQWSKHDFFYLHLKATDSAGEDGDFDRKVSVIEDADRYIPEMLALEPDVMVVTGDHSTPSVLRSHSWHPVPFLLHSKHAFPDPVDRFAERYLVHGGLGRFPAVDALRLMLGYAGKINKYGA